MVRRIAVSFGGLVSPVDSQTLMSYLVISCLLCNILESVLHFVRDFGNSALEFGTHTQLAIEK